MKAILASANGPCLQNRPSPAVIDPKDVLVNISAVAVCRTDLYAASGRISVQDGLVLGHEFSGVVAEVGDQVEHLSPGDRVAGSPSIACQKCQECLEGHPHRCAQDQFIGLDRDGAFAEQIVIPDHSLFRINDSLSFAVATLVEPVAAGLGVFESSALSSFDRATQSYAIVGSGRIANLTRELCLYKNLPSPDFISEISSTVKNNYDVIIETSAPLDSIADIIEMLSVGGTLILKSREPANLPIPILEMIHRQARIEAVRYGPFSDALSYVETNSQTLESFLDQGWALGDFKEAFRKAASSEDEKVWFKIA